MQHRGDRKPETEINPDVLFSSSSFNCRYSHSFLIPASRAGILFYLEKIYIITYNNFNGRILKRLDSNIESVMFNTYFNIVKIFIKIIIKKEHQQNPKFDRLTRRKRVIISWLEKISHTTEIIQSKFYHSEKVSVALALTKQ